MLTPDSTDAVPARDAAAGAAETMEDSVFAFCRAPQRFLLDLALRHGPAARFRLGDEQFVVLSEPDAIHAVLNGSADAFEKGSLYDIPRTTFGESMFTVDGADWTSQHIVLAPFFSRQRIRPLTSTVDTIVSRQIDSWSRLRDGDLVDMLAATKRLAFDVVGQGLLGIGDPALADELFDELREVDRTEAVRVSYLTKRMNKGQALGERFERSPFLAAVDRIDRLTYQIADERLARATQPDDLVGAAMASLLFADLAPEGKRTFVRDLIASMLTAGYVSTGEGIFWAFYVLARYPEAQRRARAEIEGVQQIDGATADGSDRSAGAGSPPLDRLPYLAAVFNESLRLYPPAWYIGRIARRSIHVGGAAIEAGTRLICSPFVLHHMPAIWPDPEAFTPERFLTNTVVAPRTLIPFGAGMRACLGRSLALMEMSALIATTLSRFDVRLASDQPVSLAGAYSMQPRDRVLFRIQRRA